MSRIITFKQIGIMQTILWFEERGKLCCFGDDFSFFFLSLESIFRARRKIVCRGHVSGSRASLRFSFSDLCAVPTMRLVYTKW